jgi:hypothetical protein
MRGRIVTQDILELQSTLPRSIPLFKNTPNRINFSWEEWNPQNVHTQQDLPQYLILGDLDFTRFKKSEDGWYACWQGIESNTQFEVTFLSSEYQYKISQTWHGLDGGISMFSSKIPLNKIIGQTLYTQFPKNWDRAAKERLESEYQLTVIEQSEDTFSFCGIPDGAFRTIAFPFPVGDLRPFAQWFKDDFAQSPLVYPVSAEAKLMFQAINYLEGKAPVSTTDEVTLFNQSLFDTSMAPHGFPIRETADDGSAAWTLRRDIYFIFISVSFAGLINFLDRTTADNSPIRLSSAPDLRIEMRPIIMPAGFDLQSESIALWDTDRTTRTFLKFQSNEDGNPPSVSEYIDNEEAAGSLLQHAEDISDRVLDEIQQIFNQTIEPGSD